MKAVVTGKYWQLCDLAERNLFLSHGTDPCGWPWSGGSSMQVSRFFSNRLLGVGEGNMKKHIHLTTTTAWKDVYSAHILWPQLRPRAKATARTPRICLPALCPGGKQVLVNPVNLAPVSKAMVFFHFLLGGIFNFVFHLTSGKLRCETLDPFILSNIWGYVSERGWSVCVSKKK